MSRRTTQVAELLAQVVSRIILTELADPRLSGIITITGAEISSDLHFAKVYFSVIGNQSDWENTENVLKKAAGFIRKLVAQRIVLKTTPKLTFVPDHTVEQAQQIEKIIETVDSKARFDGE